MNDYAHDALEALAWTLGLLEQTEDVPRIRRQVEGARLLAVWLGILFRVCLYLTTVTPLRLIMSLRPSTANETMTRMIAPYSAIRGQ